VDSETRGLDKIDQASAPIFAVTMLAEAAILWKREQARAASALPTSLVDGDLTPGRHDLPPDELVPVGYELKDTLASLGTLAGMVAIGLATMPITNAINRFLYRNRIADVAKHRKAAWISSMVLWDFLYYWDHRAQHEVRLLWANHVAHHSSQRYNLSTALRQPWTGIMLMGFFAPMPLLGFEPAMVARSGQLNLLYQYWIHTEAIDRLPSAAEAFLNTPSHHRVHHGSDQQYLDKNYGGILIVWDKLFGTFEPEIRQVTYGLTKNIKTFNPVRIGLQEYVAIGRDVVAAKGWRAKLGHVFRRPGWSPV
jgi:sterol desaturase/sphingolipid hydroxylase (fatty acid hydroxylase superfamily)